MTQGETAEFPPSPFAKHQGALDLGGSEVDVYVLDRGERVISLRATLKAIANRDGGNLAEFIGVTALKSYIDKDLVLAETIEFNIPGTQMKGRGIPAERFLDICRAYVEAWKNKALTTDRQNEIAMQCAVILSACAKVGFIALIDEATGYQYERAEDALQIKLKAFIAEELRDWEKTFPDELWEEFGRLSKWKGPLHSRPKWWGHVVLETIYEALDPDIASYLKAHKPPPRHGQNYHQWMTQDVGLKSLLTHIHQVIGVAKTCSSMKEFREKVGHLYKKEPIQLTLFVPKLPER
jgi:hypothetical protein